MGALRRHRQGARPHPPLHASAAAPIASRRWQGGTGEGVPPDRRGRVGEGAGAGFEGAEVGQHRRPLYRGRERQYRAQGCGARGLSGVAAVAACAAHGAGAAAAGQPAGASHRFRNGDHRPRAGDGLSLRRLLPSGTRRRHRRHRHHRQGCHHPWPRLPDADRVSRQRRSGLSSSIGTTRRWAAAVATASRITPRGSA